jgi:glycosyltransferase involved in cell wall biosynthesis
MRLRLGIISDYLEEGWPSMDLVANMLAGELRTHHSVRLSVGLLRPRFVRRFSSRARNSSDQRNTAFNADRLLNRFFDYPRFLRARKSEFDLFNVIDHTYAHLVPVAGSRRCVVTCHDLDAFRPLIEPRGAGSSWFRMKMSRRILDGFGSAAAVTCISVATRDAVLRHHLAPAPRLTVNPIGVAPFFNPDPNPDADRRACEALGPLDRGRLEILHVGSTIPRKRIEVLLRVFAALRSELPSVRLIRVGGIFAPAQQELSRQLGLTDSVTVLRFVEPQVLAAVYRRAALLVLPSAYEGFGLPALEALACGTPVVLSDIPVFRELGGPAATFSPVGDIERWSESILSLLRERGETPQSWHQRADAGVKWASQFTWCEHADRAVQLYGMIAAA